MKRNVLVVIPSDANDDCSLLFVAPTGMSVADANKHATAAIANANDDEGERSGEVIDYLDALAFDCLGNPSIAKIPVGITAVTVTAPMYPQLEEEGSSEVNDAVTLDALQGSEYRFIDKREDFLAIIEPHCEESDEKTGVVVKMGDGQYAEIWVTDTARPFNLDAPYVRIA